MFIQRLCHDKVVQDAQSHILQMWKRVTSNSDLFSVHEIDVTYAELNTNLFGVYLVFKCLPL